MSLAHVSKTITADEAYAAGYILHYDIKVSKKQSQPCDDDTLKRLLQVASDYFSYRSAVQLFKGKDVEVAEGLPEGMNVFERKKFVKRRDQAKSTLQTFLRANHLSLSYSKPGTNTFKRITLQKSI